MHRLLILCLLTVSGAATAQQVGMNMPQDGRSSFNYDEVRTSSGATCRQAMGSNLVGEVGIMDTQQALGGYQDPLLYASGRSNTNSAAAYARVTYFFNAPKRLDCSRLYELEIQTLQRQLDALRSSYVIPD